MTARAMPDEGFLRRWARRKTEARAGAEPLPEARAPAAPPVCQPPVAPPVAEAPPAPLPTMDDVAQLTRDSDFSAFVARGVDAAVRRTALKKLFADPHFNTMDRLDVYIDDYTQPSPVSEAMLASLSHAKRVLRRAVDAALDDGEQPADAGGGTANDTDKNTPEPPETETA